MCPCIICVCPHVHTYLCVLVCMSDFSVCVCVRCVLKPSMVSASVGPVYYTLKTGPTDPNTTQVLTNVAFNIN